VTVGSLCVCVCVREKEPGTPRFKLGVNGDWILGSLPLPVEESAVANDAGVGCVSDCDGGASKRQELHPGRYVAVWLAKRARETVMLCISEVRMAEEL
jgi:hypothetical protein